MPNCNNLCIAVFNWIIFVSASDACFNLSSLTLFASSYFFSVSSIFCSSEFTNAYKSPQGRNNQQLNELIHNWNKCSPFWSDNWNKCYLELFIFTGNFLNHCIIKNWNLLHNWYNICSLLCSFTFLLKHRFCFFQLKLHIFQSRLQLLIFLCFSFFQVSLERFGSLDKWMIILKTSRIKNWCSLASDLQEHFN